jgi:hypothetical protein
VVWRGTGRPKKEKKPIEGGETKEKCLSPDKGSVPGMEIGSCLDPRENGTGLEGGGEAGPSLPERRKDRQLKPSRDGDKMRKEEYEEPTQT